MRRQEKNKIFKANTKKYKGILGNWIRVSGEDMIYDSLWHLKSIKEKHLKANA